MRGILFVLLWLLCFGGFAQQKSMYTNETSKKPTEYDKNIYRVTFEKSMYSLTFENQTPIFLKPLITRFMDKKQRNYTALGSYTFKIINRKGKYYIVERKQPEKLILLD